MDNRTLMSDFSTFLKQKRQAMGLSQTQLAVRIYGDAKRKSYISDIETGRKDITMNTAGFILEALNSWIEFVE